jgi:hypothetical protein
MLTEKQTSRDDFEYWLADMDDALDRFLGSLPEQIRSRLDFSVESLNVLESWIIDTYPDPKAMMAPGESERLGGTARYIGETIRNVVGGYWDIDLKNRNNVYFGLPQVTGFSSTPTPECPLSLATATADRRSGKYLSTIVENMQRDYGAKK